MVYQIVTFSFGPPLQRGISAVIRMVNPENCHLQKTYIKNDAKTLNIKYFIYFKYLCLPTQNFILGFE